MSDDTSLPPGAFDKVDQGGLKINPAFLGCRLPSFLTGKMRDRGAEDELNSMTHDRSFTEAR